MLEHFNNLKSEDENIRLLALTAISNECKNVGTSEEAVKSFGYCVERLAKGMQSNNLKTRIEFFSALVTIFKVNHSIKLPSLIEIIQKALVTKEADTKNERKMTQMARILSLGAIIRAKEKVLTLPSNISATKRILVDLVAIAEKKKVFKSLATPFICQLLKVLPVDQIDEDCVNALQPVLVRNEKPKANVDFLKIVLTADSRGITPELASIESADEIVDILVAGVQADDSEMLQLIFQYIKKKNYFEEFWQQLQEKIGPYKSQLFCTCITHSVKNGCPLKFALKEDVVTLLLTTLHNQDLGKEVKTEAESAFRSILSWKDVDESSLSKKDRKKILKRLYKGTPNLLHEYKILAGPIKSHLQCLTTKELGYLYDTLVDSVNSQEKSTRVQLSALTLISHISHLSAASSELQVESTKLFFHKGFCKSLSSDVPSTANDDNDGATNTEGDESTPKKDSNADGEDDAARKRELIQTQCATLFFSGIRRNFNLDTISAIYDYIVPIIKNKTEEPFELTTPLKDEALKLIKKSGKILKKVEHQLLVLITKVGVLHLLSDQEDYIDTFENWLEVAKKAEEGDTNLQTILYILDNVVHEDHPFFPYEAVFRKIVMQEQVSEEVIQALADAIDPGDSDGEDDGNDEDDDDDDDEDESEDDDVEEDSNSNKKKSTLKLNGTGKKVEKKLNGDANADSDSDDTIDMDEATEEDLKNMDKALANVFSIKKKVKQQGLKENRTYTRVLTLVDILIGRYKEPPISVALMLLMPLVSSLKNNLSGKDKHNTLQRTLGTLRRLNKLKKFSGMEEVDAEITSTMAQEINELMKKKVVPKVVKDVLSRSITNLLGCGKDKEDKAIVKETNKKTKKAKKNKKSKSANSPANNNNNSNKSGSISNVVKPEINGETNKNSSKSKEKTKNKEKKKDKAVDGNKILEETTVSKKVPAKRKATHQHAVAAKKKAKLLRMQVFSEGLSTVE